MEVDPILWQMLLQLVLIGLNAVFACAEIAVISMNDNKLAQLVSQGDKRALRLARLTSQPARFLATIQVAITLSGFLGSAFAADNFSDRLVQYLLSIGTPIPLATLDAISVIVITLILSYFTLVFGELVPKRLAMKKAEPLALGMASMISFVAHVTSPIVWFLTLSTNTILRLLGLDPNAEEDELSEEEIRMMVDIGTQKGVIDADEKEIIQNVFDFDDTPVGEFSTHRTKLSILWLEDDLEEWERTIHETRFSRYPICEGSADNVLAILNVKDYFRLQDKSRENILAHAVHPAYFVPQSICADVLFRQMKASRNHFAVVLDEYGGVYGVVTLYDLLEQLVGDLDPKLQEEVDDTIIESLPDHLYRISGGATLGDVNKQLGIRLPGPEHSTFGSFVFDRYGFIPTDGTQFELSAENLQIKVTEILNHRLKSALVSLSKDGSAGKIPMEAPMSRKND